MNPVSSPLPSTFSYILQPDIVLDFSNQLCFARVVNVSFFHSSFLFYSFLFYPTITIRETYVTTFSSSLIRNRRNKLSYRVISDRHRGRRFFFPSAPLVENTEISGSSLFFPVSYDSNRIDLNKVANRDVKLYAGRFTNRFLKSCSLPLR